MADSIELARTDALEHARCAACGYELKGLAIPGACPECNLPLEESLRDVRAQAIARRDRRILARMDWYDRNRRGAWSLAMLSAGGVVAIAFAAQFVGTSNNQAGLMMVVGLSNCAFWGMVAFANHARYQHAQSIAARTKERVE